MSYEIRFTRLRRNAIHGSAFLKMNWRIYIVAGFLWAVALAGAAQARSRSYLLSCSSNGNMTATDVLNWDSYISGQAQWSISNAWLQSLQWITLDDGPYTVGFSRIKDFYKPDTVADTVANDDFRRTNYYHIYSNTLSVVVAGISGGASASWRLTDSPANEYTNSSVYSAHSSGLFSNTSPLYSYTLSTIPTGTYSISFNAVRGHQSPPATNISIAGTPYAWFSTNTYQPYTNGLTVVIAGTSGTNVVWTLSPPADYTNCTFTNLNFTNTYTLTPIPTGTYVATFPTLSGYTTPGAVTSVVISGTNSVTGTYSCVNGHLRVTMTPSSVTSSAPWNLTGYPAGYTNGIFSGTGERTISNVMIGAYTVTFGDLTGYTTPSAGSETVYSNTLSTIIGAYTFSGHALVVDIGQPYARDLAGVGSGPCRVEYGSTITTQTASQATYSVNDDDTVTLTALTNYVYIWYINPYDTSGSASIYDAKWFTNSISFVMDDDKRIWLLYSRPYNSYDNAGDIDQDQLPDRWEVTWLIPASRQSDWWKYDYTPQSELFTNTYANPDNDFIPSTSTNPPMQVSISTNGVITYLGAGGITPDYPLQRDRLLSHKEAYVSASSLGYSTGSKFNNYFECRGFDRYYLTNGPSGSVASDDPLTDPTKSDTDGDGMTDGWEYYFWYWRSAAAYSAGLSNSANLSWVTLTPTTWNMPDGDTDNDGIYDLEEHDDYWTDPTHCDTDADCMDDYWEVYFDTATISTNALDYLNNLSNPDGDYMAQSSNTTVLTVGMVGTALGTNVCWSGGSITNPNAAWNEIYTNTGANVFDLYKDTILKASASLTNHAAGTRYTHTNYYGTNASAGTYKNGYPVWVDINDNGTYSAGDVALVDPYLKHDALYVMAPTVTNIYPGACSFSPLTAWTNSVTTNHTAAPDTLPYTTYQEYLGGDYIGRLSWDAGGQRSSINDDALALNRNGYSNPNNQDTDSDLMPDGWELYVGLNDNSAADAGLDSDGDTLNNASEWANATHSLGTCAATWPLKLLPTDPGVIIAPQPNDPHPKDTDWDSVSDGAEKTALSNPTSWDTDGDHLPDGWELYAGTSITNSDALLDPDADGLFNWQEYWCGAVPEWQFVNPDWGATYFCVRRAMSWDPALVDPATNTVFIPPDYLTDPCFMYVNGVHTDLGYLRTNYPASFSLEGDYANYHTPRASGLDSSGEINSYDSDGDNMDDYWEVYHGLNPCLGILNLMAGHVHVVDVDEPDADPNTPGYQFGLFGQPFNSLTNYIAYIEPVRTNLDLRATNLVAIVGPFNFGLDGMDPDGDGLPNLEEYSYSRNRSFYHTDPTPIWRTDQNDASSFVARNYGFDMAPSQYFDDWDSPYASGLVIMFLGFVASPFYFEETEGYDTDNDGVSDYAEINSAAGQTGNNPLDDRNPIRNRALYVNGTNDFTRQINSRAIFNESTLVRFCIEAWIKPDNPALAGNQVIIEKAGVYDNPLDPGNSLVGANFRMGLTNGLPYVLYNGRGSLRNYQATAQTRHRITSNTNWTHIAGSYDGTNLIVYVNGEESLSLRTTELPANGYDVQTSSNTFKGTSHTLMVGARDDNAGSEIFSSFALPPSPADYFGGCIDEVRVWNGTRTRAEILANKNRRLTQSDITNTMTAIYNYFTFDDAPDPNRSGEAVYPAGMANISPDMHPTVGWWQNYAMRSTVYTGVTNSYNYVVYASDHAWHSRPVFPAADDHYHSTTNYTGTNAISGYVNPGNPYYEIDLLFLNANYDLLLFRGARSVATNSWLSGLSDDPDSTDSDGDGLPDWWEQLYNLDPNDAAGNNGAWGDVDNDGLNNRGEYLAGTNPRNSDTDGDGIGDYDSRSGPYHRTWGEMYMDGDGMPDTWEIQYGLDPYHYDAHLDLDNDGWSNYAEYLAGTNPNDSSSFPQPIVIGSVSYFGSRDIEGNNYRFYAYSINTMDGIPEITKVGAGETVEATGTADGTRYFNVRLPVYPLDQSTVVTISAPLSGGTNSAVFVFTGPTTYTYTGPGQDYAAGLNYVTGVLSIRWASGGVPAAGAVVSIDYVYLNRNSAVFTLTGFKEGDTYIMGYIDLNNSSSFDIDEPMGILEDQPLYIGYTSPNNVRIQVKDTAPGYGRFVWTGNTSGTGDYPVVLNKTSESGAPTVLTRTMRWPRNFFHEWDYQLQGLYGLTTGDYQWWMNGQQGTFKVTWPASVSTPYLVYPRGDQLNYAKNQFKWTMDSYSTKYHLQVARQSADRGLAMVIDQYYPIPYCDANGIYQADLPLYAGEMGDGIYYWRVAGWNPAGESAWSDVQTFAINLSATNSHWIAGNVYYFGKADCSNIIVEAFANAGFSGKPDARVLLTGAARTNSFKGSFTLRGLEEGTYYVRAYLDVTPAGGTRDGKRNSPWESWGFIRDPNNDYQPRAIALLNTMFMDGTKLVIRDQDTDNDLLPDAWEMYYFGDLYQTGDMDYDGDGETNLEEYMRDDVDMNPAAWDTDGDGLSDAFEIKYTAPSFGYSAKSGIQLNPMLWDTDGDGYSDGAELKRYHTNPLDPTSYPGYQPMCFDAWRSPGDYDGDGRSDLGIYDVTSGKWYLMTAGGVFFNLPFGNSSTLPMLGDYTGDGCDEFSLFDSSTGDWHLYDAWSGQSFSMRFGDSEMIPVPADYSGDGKVDLAVYYPAEGTWFIYNLWTGELFTLTFGGPSCVPVPGDYNSDGMGDLAVYEPNSGDWNIFAFDHYRHEGRSYSGNFGGPTMIPVPGDYDGDGRSDAVLFDTATATWYILTWRGQFLSGQFGCYGCIPAAGDYDGDGRTDVCVYYPPTGMWYIYCWSGQLYQVQFGYPAATPVQKGR